MVADALASERGLPDGGSALPHEEDGEEQSGEEDGVLDERHESVHDSSFRSGVLGSL